MSTIDQASMRVFAELLKRALAKKPTHIEQIDILRDEPGGEVVAWVHFAPGDDDCFAVSFKPRLPIPDGEIRRLLTRNPLAVARANA